MESALKIMQIVFSSRIYESNLIELENQIKTHTSNVLKFDKKQRLKPKLHFLTHYPHVVRQMGPVIHFWTMRMEAKHKVFTTHARRVQNFKNITKTLSNNHQKQSLNIQKFEDTIKEAKTRLPINDIGPLDILQPVGSLDSTYKIDFVHFNHLTYRPGMFFIYLNSFFEIIHIVSNNEEVWFVCKPFKAVRFDKFLNSIEITATDSMILINMNDIEKTVIYQKALLGQKMYIKCETLDIQLGNIV